MSPFPQSTGKANCFRLDKYSIISSGNNIKFLPSVWGLLIGHNILHEAHKVIITPYPQHIMLWIRCKWVLINIFRSFSSSELTPTKLHLKNCTWSQLLFLSIHNSTSCPKYCPVTGAWGYQPIFVCKKFWPKIPREISRPKSSICPQLPPKNLLIPLTFSWEIPFHSHRVIKL